jgi:hypothetical protein
MSKVTKEDVSKAVREYVEALNEYNAMLEKTTTIIITSDFKNSEIVLAGEKVEKLHHKWRELDIAYRSQRQTL